MPSLKTPFEPTGQQLLIETINSEEKRLSGLIIPDSAQNTRHAIIKKIGKAVPRSLYSVEDEIIFAPETAFAVSLPEANNLFILPYQRILLHNRKNKIRTEII